MATTWIGFYTWMWSTRHCGLDKKWLVDFNAGKTQLVLFDQSNNTGSIDVKMDVSVLEENHLLRCGWPSFLSWTGALALSLLLQLPPRKLEPSFILWNFFLLRLLCISINLPYAHVWNTVVTSGLLPLVATWNCYKSYKSEYAGLLLLHLLLFLNHWLIVEVWKLTSFL